MASGIFTIDGVPYDVFIPQGGITRSFKILDGPNAGRMLDATMTRDIIGTFYNYKVSIAQNNPNPEIYDRLYEILSSPKDSHTIILPYGQKTISFEAYVTGGDDRLKRKSKSGAYWDSLTLEFIAMSPYRRP